MNEAAELAKTRALWLHVGMIMGIVTGMSQMIMISPVPVPADIYYFMVGWIIFLIGQLIVIIAAINYLAKK